MSKKSEPQNTALVEVRWVQMKFRVPEPVRRHFKEEARNLKKTDNAYFLALWDQHLQTYLNLLAQTQADLKKAAKQAKKKKA